MRPPRILTRLAPLAALLFLVGCGGNAAPAVSTSPSPKPAPTTSAPLYTVAKTWPNEDGLGAGATLVVASESRSQAQAAIKQYIRAEGRDEYLYIEVLGHPDATEWICAGEYLASEADLKYAVFDMTKNFVNFPADWIECR